MALLCRLCMQKHSQLKNIYQKHNQYIIQELINRYIPEIYLNENELDLSRFICKDCLDILCKIERLREISTENEKIQRALTIDIKVEVVYNQPCCKLKELPNENETNEINLKPLTVEVTERKVYQCFHCDEYSFTEKADLEAHLLTIHQGLKLTKNPKYFKCRLCDVSYLDLNDIRSHLHYDHNKEAKQNILRVNSSNKFGCFICDQNGLKTSFHIKAKLQEHIMTQHLKVDRASHEMYFQCMKCDESFLFFHELTSHSLYVHNDSIKRDKIKRIRLREKSKNSRASALKCIKCNIKFEKQKDFSFHNNIHADFVRELPKDIPVRYECALCAFNSSNENELHHHLPVHAKDFTENPSRILVCINCSTIIKDYEALRMHLNVHNAKLTHECLKCNKKFPFGVRLLRHIQKHRLNEKLKCEYKKCTFTCATRPQMKDHVKHKHHKEVIHLCPTCGSSFSQPGSLRNHIKNIHEKNNFIYQCEKCPMVFRVPSHLRNHQAVHTTEYNFKCEHPGCTKIFRAKRNLKLHQRFHDRSQLNYKFPCSFCERKFLTRDAARRHSYTHTKVKPYICTFAGCDRAFSQSNDLNKHLRTHFQQEETYFCSYENCKQSFRLKAELRFHEGLHYQTPLSSSSK